MKTLTLLSKTALIATSLFIFSCSNDDDNNTENPIDQEQSVFHIAADVDNNETAEVQIAPATVLNDGEFSIVENGTQMEGVRSAYLAEANGLIYNLNYGTGVIRELEFDGEATYNVLSEVDASPVLGTHPRFEVVGDQDKSLMAFYVAAAKSEDEQSVQVTLQVIEYDLPGLNFSNSVEIDLGTYGIGEYYVSRVDAPVIHEGKVYFGTQQKNLGYSDVNAVDLKTIVLDYPALDNHKIVSTTASKGHNYGYRGRSMYVHNNAVYQINWPVDEADVIISRLKNADYDESYTFNITEALGGGVYGSVNWFHIGNGKGYAAIEDKSIDADNNWFLVYIDVDAKTVQRVAEIPLSDLFYYQSAVVTDGNVFNIAISPYGDESYIWQVNGASATKGTQLDGGNVYVQGIY